LIPDGNVKDHEMVMGQLGPEGYDIARFDPKTGAIPGYV
jgi:hypothetical protein